MIDDDDDDFTTCRICGHLKENAAFDADLIATCMDCSEDAE